ncbi:MAG: hypothetical protein H7069_05760, partial [Phormidesmis sp. FL-bin-119]|nr:hypothetical protein [Pedobacter sp.]
GNPVNGQPDNAIDRKAVTNRPDRVTTTRPNDQVGNRPEAEKLPASSQRSTRTYDNQDIRGSQSAQREPEHIAERQSQQSSQSPVSQREQSAESRPQTQERPQQREVNRDNTRQESERSSSQERSTERSSGGGRPSRNQ